VRVYCDAMGQTQSESESEIAILSLALVLLRSSGVEAVEDRVVS